MKHFPSDNRYYGTQQWKNLREIKLSQDPLCELCKDRHKTTPATLVHHMIPTDAGGEMWDMSNLQSLCNPCHESIHKRYSSSVSAIMQPDLLKRVKCRVIIVCGPPASGKTTWAKAQGGVVLDLDDIKEELFGFRNTRDGRKIRAAIWERNKRLLNIPAGETAYVITSAPAPKQRKWWIDNVKAESIMILTHPGECEARIVKDKTRPAQEQVGAVKRWWKKYKPLIADRLVGDVHLTNSPA